MNLFLDESKSSLLGIKKKKFKNNNTNYLSYLINVMIGAVFIYSYFLLNHYLGDAIITDL